MPNILMEVWNDELVENENLEEKEDAWNTDAILE